MATKLMFSGDMETGVAKIDAQHKELIDRINAVISMEQKVFSKEETKKTLDFLGEYVVKHFTDEEALQVECKYPKYEWHKEQHQNFVNDFQKLRSEFVTDGASMKFTLDLNQSVISWVIKHIKSADVEFGRYYKEHIK